MKLQTDIHYNYEMKYSTDWCGALLTQVQKLRTVDSWHLETIFNYTNIIMYLKKNGLIVWSHRPIFIMSIVRRYLFKNTFDYVLQLRTVEHEHLLTQHYKMYCKRILPIPDKLTSKFSLIENNVCTISHCYESNSIVCIVI